MFTLPEPSIKFVVPEMVLTLIFVIIKLNKYIFSRSIVCGCAISKTYITFIHLEIQEHIYSEKDKNIKSHFFKIKHTKLKYIKIKYNKIKYIKIRYTPK